VLLVVSNGVVMPFNATFFLSSDLSRRRRSRATGRAGSDAAASASDARRGRGARRWRLMLKETPTKMRRDDRRTYVRPVQTMTFRCRSIVDDR